ncbi:hypothetical protein BDU57DRAFT_536425 [Ampelomyces quisqualis]|uniref:Uncharacterized protein n=1 Tax=Ampelomyces quisqualis TaxID=50730 RepID=A0A6A5QXR3_AMPQU|nr:hypothetical protein BDU57DRAFT_536425 [Ampelomyces quisqualis]
MAAIQDAVDPEYNWILPERMEIKSEISGGDVPFELFLKNTPDSIRTCLSSMAGIGTFATSGIYFIAADKIWTALVDEKWRAFKSETKELDVTTFAHRFVCLETLQHIGLDVQGGVAMLNTAIEASQGSKQALSMVRIIVENSEKARQYLNIGVQIGKDIPEHPSTLEEAADAYAKVSSLINDNRTAMYLERKIAACTSESNLWAWKRLLFRINTKERYRQILLDLAQEQRLDEQLMNLREKKRARLDG